MVKLRLQKMVNRAIDQNRRRIIRPGRNQRMGTTFEMSDITVHRIIEGEYPFKPAPEFLAGLTPELLAENRPWMQPTFLDEQDRVLICIQSYVLRTPHHVILIDSCVGNNKTHAWWPAW